MAPEITIRPFAQPYGKMIRGRGSKVYTIAAEKYLKKVSEAANAIAAKTSSLMTMQ